MGFFSVFLFNVGPTLTRVAATEGKKEEEEASRGFAQNNDLSVPGPALTPLSWEQPASQSTLGMFEGVGVQKHMSLDSLLLLTAT